ncbi:MAG: lipopolysaccharide assembly protein LapB [Thiocapsa sp.]|jgi:lipopolysaccharide biosynthesis regulator YciM|nr:lipopolysaccharide assembly protein LapB [Thiocapsa sp.]MCG6897768.1 lipopolysaccharide assembly protein LapB [Thiocapsa sp.]MCG6986297.1 lipopolysaccharide assembly protein LapB [Thiocapsa sp.]
MMELLFLLLPLAAASGWWMARRGTPLRRNERSSPHPAFLRGLNYLLEEQPDKAIDMFLELVEVDGETVETHLALGSLFRRRGEVDRAIRIHQNLIARKNLSVEQRGDALFELGQDYMRAGLLDRAELLFQELVELRLNQQRALQSLRELYEQERDWAKCLEVTERLKPLTDHPMGVAIAQYHCELAEEARRAGRSARAQAELRSAHEADPGCVRAMMLEGRAALADGDPERAWSLFMQVAEQHAAYVPEVLPELIEALRQLGRDDVPGVLEGLARRHSSPALILSLSEVVAESQGQDAAMELLTRYLSRYADLAALERLFSLQASQAPEADRPGRDRVRVALEVIRHLLARQPVYQCDHCGFQARSLHWQCPSCRCWGCVVPVQPEPIIGDEVLHERRLA